MKRLLFAQSYILREDPKEFRAMAPYPPLGTLYGATAAREAGYQVELFDAMLASSAEDIIPIVQRTTPDVLVIYDDDFNYLTKMCLTRMREVAFRLIEIGKKAGALVLLHSSDATDQKRAYLEAGADFLLIGEAEGTLLELLAWLDEDEGREAWSIPGVCTLAEGEVVVGPPRPVTRDLDTISFPSRDLVDIDRYADLWRRHHGRFSMNMVTTRGCPFHCNWCAKPLYGQIYSSRSPANVAEEVAEVARTYDPDHLWFCDDIFGLKPGWVESFAEELERRSTQVPFKALSRADLLLRGETISALARAGCETIWIGAESGSQKVLNAMEKGTTIGQIEEARRRLGEVGIATGFFLQFGYPGEGSEEIAATIAMVRRTLPEEIGVSVSYPLPGTSFYDTVLEEMKQQKNWRESADLAMMFEGSFGTDFYRELARFVHYDHRLRLGLRAGGRVFRFERVARSGLRRLLLTPWYLIRREVHRVGLRRNGGPWRFAPPPTPPSHPDPRSACASESGSGR